MLFLKKEIVTSPQVRAYLRAKAINSLIGAVICYGVVPFVGDVLVRFEAKQKKSRELRYAATQ